MKKTLVILSTGLLAMGPVCAGQSDSDELAANADYAKVSDELYKNKWQSSDIVDATVYSHPNKEVGTVADFELNENGGIEALYVELNDGLLGLFANTVVRLDYDTVELVEEKTGFQIRESNAQAFSNFIARFVEETRDGADYVADSFEKGAQKLMNTLQNDETSMDHLENVGISIKDDVVYLSGTVESEEIRDRIGDIVENNTRLQVVNNLNINH